MSSNMRRHPPVTIAPLEGPPGFVARATLPPYVQQYLRDCVTDRVSIQHIGPWGIYLYNRKVVYTPFDTCYAVDGITIQKPIKAKNIISPKTITITTPLTPGTRVTAKHICNCADQPEQVVFSCQSLFNTSTQPVTCLEPPDRWIQAGPLETKPACQEYHQYPSPITEPPPNKVIAPGGYSTWHILALGLLKPADAKTFIESTLMAPDDILLADLKEVMVRLPDILGLDAMSQISVTHLSWGDLMTLAAYRTPFELCLLTKRTLLDSYGLGDSQHCHPFVMALHKQTVQALHPVQK